MKVVKGIIPAAGLGTRFLPATKVTPKEMFPLIDKPAIQYSVEEGIRSGIQNFIFVTGKNKRSVEDHFDTFPELYATLESRGKRYVLSALQKIIEDTDFTYVRQHQPLGLGHAIWSARHAVGHEPVAIFLPDDVITGTTPAIAQLIKVAQQEKCNVVAVREVAMDQVSSYGVIDIKKQFSPNLFQVKSLVEKPSASHAPSNLAILGRYVLSPTIFDMLDDIPTGTGGEIQLTDAIHSLIANGEKVFALKVQGTMYDTGTPMGWLRANIELALKHPDYSAEMLDYLKHLDKDLTIMEGKIEQLHKNKSAAI